MVNKKSCYGTIEYNKSSLICNSCFLYIECGEKNEIIKYRKRKECKNGKKNKS